MAVRTGRITGPIEIVALYAAPGAMLELTGGVTALIKCIRVVNPSSIAKGVRLFVNGSGTSALVLERTIGANDTYVEVSHLALTGTDSLLAAQSSATGAELVLTLSGSILSGETDFDG